MRINEKKREGEEKKKEKQQKRSVNREMKCGHIRANLAFIKTTRARFVAAGQIAILNTLSALICD